MGIYTFFPQHIYNSIVLKMSLGSLFITTISNVTTAVLLNGEYGIGTEVDPFCRYWCSEKLPKLLMPFYFKTFSNLS